MERTPKRDSVKQTGASQLDSVVQVRPTLQRASPLLSLVPPLPLILKPSHWPSGPSLSFPQSPLPPPCPGSPLVCLTYSSPSVWEEADGEGRQRRRLGWVLGFVNWSHGVDLSLDNHWRTPYCSPRTGDHLSDLERRAPSKSPGEFELLVGFLCPSLCFVLSAIP